MPARPSIAGTVVALIILVGSLAFGPASATSSRIPPFTAVIWQASVPVAIGTLIGVPLGIAAGRLAWHKFASQLYVVPEPAISVVTVVVVAISALVLANLTAILPGRRAARTSAAAVLRAE
jgi:predicted lysophospholipase L1 biosynthesis ABC-type transport system permease subunit